MHRIALLFSVLACGCIVETHDRCPRDNQWPVGDSPLDRACRARFCREQRELFAEQCAMSEMDVDAAEGGMGDGSTQIDGSADAEAPLCERCPPSAPVCVDGECAVCAENRHCSGEAPVCLEQACVECTPFDDQRCRDQGLVCQNDDSRCVECNNSRDCTDPSASRCDTATHECVGCASNRDCADILGAEGQALSVCSGEHVCVECTGLDYLVCGFDDKGKQRVCDSLAQTCSGETAGSAGLCGACVSDAECAQGQRCVLQRLNGQDVGYFCFWETGAEGAPSDCGLSRPYVQQQTDAVSVDGHQADVCTLARASCPAMRNFFTAKPGCGLDAMGMSSSSNDDQACGAPGLDDGLCRVLTPATNVCTVPCLSSLDCEPGIACNKDAAPRYCDLEAGTCWDPGDCGFGQLCIDNVCQ